jgi:hypothetical protein
MATFRGPQPQDHFAQIPNAWLRDPNLTMADKGLLAYILSHSPEYPLTVEQMVKENANGADAVAMAMKRLERAGYLRRERQRNKNGRLGHYDWHLVSCNETPRQTDQSGKTATGSDLRKQGKRPGRDQSGKTTDGPASLVKPGTKKTRDKNTREELVSALNWSGAPGGAHDDDDRTPLPVVAAEPDPPGRPTFTDWRAEDRALFRAVVGDRLCCDGVVWRPAGSFDADVWYEALRRHPGRPLEWPGRYVDKLRGDGGVEEWLAARGLTVDDGAGLAA